MKVATTELINLVNLVLNDLEHSRWIILEAYDQREQVDANNDLMTKMAAGAMRLGMAKAIALNQLLATEGIPSPNGEGLELIEFWIALEQVTREDEADDT
jgi:hypothetical protein